MGNLPANKNRRVLVIDDNHSIHDDFRKILSPGPSTTSALDATEAAVFGETQNTIQQTRFEVDSAYQGEEGFLLAKKALEAETPYAMAFVDVRMPPGWDGVETTRKIWELDPNLQIVLCTAYSDYSWDEMFDKLGHNDGLLILKKPFDGVEALQLAHALTEKWWLRQQSQRKLEELENQVAERTQELQNINCALRTEVIDHERAEETLRGSEEKFRQLADNITDVFWITSPDLKIIHYISPGYEMIWGRSTESLYANPHQWIECILPEECERVSAIFGTLTQNEPSVSVEYRIARPDGTIRWVHDRGFQVRDAAGKLVRLAGVVTDITERKRAADELRESERRFNDMLRNLELVSVMVDGDTRITYCNDYLLRLTGWQRDEVIGRDWFEIFLPPEIVAELQDVRTALLADQPVAWHHENEIVTRSGARRLIRWNNSVLRSASGEVVGTASIGEDITERKQLETQLFQSQKMETVGKLAGGIAHEFNSILTAIIGRSELLLNDLAPGSMDFTNAMAIRKAADLAASLTKQLLAYGRKQMLRSETLNLNQILSAMEGMLRHLMGGDVDVRLVPAAGLPVVKADAGQIEQVIMNIAINAREAMRGVGKLTLETSRVTLDEEYVRHFPEVKVGEYVMLAISDSGMGMNEEVKAHLFEPFFTTKGVGEGTGLGLATCHGIIKQSGGHITAYSELGRGTTFKIYLPAQVEPRAEAAAPKAAVSDLPRGTETILLVEDDPSLREMASLLLQRLGYTVLVATNGAEALKLTQQPDTGHIDLLFTDIVMPQMDGKELADRIRATHPRTKTLFTSAYTENAAIHQGVLEEGVALLQKPFTPSALAQKLRAVLDGRS